MLRAGELRQKSAGELLGLLTETLKSLRTKSVEVMTSKAKNVKEPRGIRKDIARIKGILKEKQILEERK